MAQLALEILVCDGNLENTPFTYYQCVWKVAEQMLFLSLVSMSSIFKSIIRCWLFLIDPWTFYNRCFSLV